ncbi:MAG: thioredoxin domain-containing protein [Rhodocyclaceae bacterium]
MANLLAGQTSPYLLQHAGNPVDWHPWGARALELAREQDKPILLSIGYSACHWCHVMARESFEDAAVAALMNRLYINIKVDREERPDLDHIYQSAHQVLTQRAGGWPLTMFLMPDGTPFFGGTYFPRSPRYGLPGFPEILERVAAAYHGRRREIAQQNRALAAALARTLPDAAADAPFSDRPIERLAGALASGFDPVHGGFGGAPKFPHPCELDFLLRRSRSRADERPAAIVTATLARMAEGGIHDQLGGGFFRYSVDERWAIPHFEKMLYDNALLLRLYADAWLVTRDPLFAATAGRTAGWVMREMQSGEGGYWSSLDADSGHEEGAFYLWTPDELRGVLSDDTFSLAQRHWGLAGPPNFENRRWHLAVSEPLGAICADLGIAAQDGGRRIEEARAQLLAVRDRRVRPGCDDKILTSWNALMIEAMTHAGVVFRRPDWLASAGRALDFVRGTMYRNGRLLATCRGARARLDAYLDDHAFLLAALIERMQAGFRGEDLAFAIEIADTLLARFEDREAGGFFFTGHDHETLIHRPKPAQDGSTPGGNAVAAFALQRLGHLCGDARYLDSARRTLALFLPQMEREPWGCATLAVALEEHLAPPTLVVLRGREADSWLERLHSRYQPHTIAAAVGEQERGLPPVLDKPAGSAVNAWVCSGVHCLPPIEDPAEFEKVLANRASRGAN